MSNPDFKKTASRRTVLKAGTAALTTAIFAPNIIRPAQAADVITLLTWETYHDDDWIAEWGKANNTEVRAVRIGSEDELFSQAFSGAVHADILYVETGSLQRFKGSQSYHEGGPSQGCQCRQYQQGVELDQGSGCWRRPHGRSL